MLARQQYSRRCEVTPSDQLEKLAIRAKQAEEHVAAARAKAKADLEDQVEAARTSAQAQGEKLRDKADAEQGQILDTWNGAQRAWNQHIVQAHERFAAKKAELDTAKAKRTAEHAERDASYAIEYAFAAVEEAEYAALDASLARMEADELSGAAVG